MPYATRHLRMVVGGTGYPGEIWSWGLNMIYNFEGQAVPDAPDAVPQAVIDAVQTFHSSSARMGIAAALRWIKLNEIDETGHYANQHDTVVYDFPNPVYPNSGAGNYPPAQLSMAVTLRTNRARGPASRGRFYIPYAAVSIENSGLVQLSQAQGLADSASTLVSALNAALDGWDVGVVSDVGNGAQEPVRSVEVGRVPDTIRRRRNQLLEQYVTATTPVEVVEPF
jgi:hypothetical protein